MSENPYPALLELHSNNMRNYLYRCAFEDGYCGNPQDPNCVAAAARALKLLFEENSVGEKVQHLATVRRQVETLIEKLFLLTPEKAPLMTVGTARDWFFYLKSGAIATAVVALRVLMTNETAARGGDHTHAAADVIWAELQMFLKSRSQTMLLHKNHLCSFASFPVQMVVQAIASVGSADGEKRIVGAKQKQKGGKKEDAANHLNGQ